MAFPRLSTEFLRQQLKRQLSLVETTEEKIQVLRRFGKHNPHEDSLQVYVGIFLRGELVHMQPVWEGVDLEFSLQDGKKFRGSFRTGDSLRGVGVSLIFPGEESCSGVVEIYPNQAGKHFGDDWSVWVYDNHYDAEAAKNPVSSPRYN